MCTRQRCVFSRVRRAPQWTGMGIVLAVTIALAGLVPGVGWAQCSCPWLGDLNASGAVNATDLSMLIDVISGGVPSPQDPNCPQPRADINADGYLDIRDLSAFVDELFMGGATIVDPCDCITQPALCDPVVDPTPGEPGNSVVVYSGSVIAGATDVRIPIYVSNDVALRGLTVPLIVREITPGAFITAALPSFEERLDLTQNFFDRINQYADADGSCPGGFGTITHLGLEQSGVKQAVTASPEGYLFMIMYVFNEEVPAGSDVDGSIALTVDVGNTLGTFEIDTTCIEPNNHLVFIEAGIANNTPITPSFTKGTITIAENEPPVALCQNVTVWIDSTCAPVDASIDDGSYDPEGGDIILTQSPPGPYPLGTTVVTLTVEDDQGATAQCQATVTVEDTIPPAIVCPDDIHLNIAPVYQGWVIAFDVTATDNCPGEVTIVTSQESGTFFPNGTTEVFCTATDEAGNESQCSFLVTIVAECYDRRGDANCDGVVDAVDVNLIIDATFFNGEIPPCTSPPGTEPSQ